VPKAKPDHSRWLKITPDQIDEVPPEQYVKVQFRGFSLWGMAYRVKEAVRIAQGAKAG
jgi:hypothetical protein